MLANQCCCGCSLTTGAYFLLSANLVRCLLFIGLACDAVFHKEQDLYLQVAGSLAEKVSLAALSIIGATFTLFAFWGVYARMVQAVQLALYFFLFQYVLDIGAIVWETVVHVSCDDLSAALASSSAHPFACGLERVLWLSFDFLVMCLEGYFLYILQSFCQAVVVQLPTQPFAELYRKHETDVAVKYLHPYNHLYGAVPGHNDIAGEAVMAGASLGAYRIFDGTYHDMSFPPGSCK
mmetsp:Transcript_36787/g.68469  ORF Transcript_36787/g.68469 Transcript_36787/m.68469 type:complete len:236 (+) Transcript_36787:89-796(+)